MSHSPMGNELPRRRPVPGAPGVYFRPRRDRPVGPPFEFAYRDLTGRRRWRTVHDDLPEALRQQGELRQRRRRPAAVPAAEALRFDTYARAWLSRQNVRPRTKDRYRWAIEQHLIPRIGAHPLPVIDADLIAALTAELRAAKLSGWTIATALQPLTAILNDAVRKGHLRSNPAHTLTRTEKPGRHDQRPHRILNLDEIHTLLDATTDPKFRCLLELLILSGARIGEALGLTATDLDPTSSIIHIRRQLDRDKTLQPLKTAASNRLIDLPDPLLARMRTLIPDHQPDDAAETLIFQSRNGTGLERKVCRDALKRAADAANLQRPHPTLHDLRHSHASMLIGIGYSIADVQHRLGHARPDVTLRVYTHQWRHHDAQTSTIGNHLGTLIDTPTDGAPNSSTTAPKQAPTTAKTRRTAATSHSSGSW